jgi:endonuclease/exonuclease/phosphatase family metal-dependent hydrolase
MDPLHVATLNIRNIADRWPERQGLLYADMAALQPDLLGLQEVVFVVQQDRLIGAAGEGFYTAVRGWAGRPEYGNSLLLRTPLVAESFERLELSFGRAVFRLRLTLPAGATVVVVVTHLHHPPDAAAERDAQTAAIVDWLKGSPAADGLIVMGDFNADPDEPAYGRMTKAGFRSAHFVANGREPAYTWPSGIQAPGMDTDGEADCLDYIWVRGAIGVRECGLAFDRPDPTDPTLYPTDHLGLAAHLEIG